MNKSVGQLAQTLLPCVALESIENHWRNTLSGSIICRFWTALKQPFVLKPHPLLHKLASQLQMLSFLIILALTVAIGMPQFAGDKEGLALIVLAAVSFSLLGALLGGKERYQSSGIDIAVLAFLYANIVATFASHYLAASLIGLAKVVVYILSYFLFTARLSQSRSRIYLTLACLLLTGLAVALYGLYQYKIGVAPLATWEDPNVEIKGTRIYSTLGNPNLLAAYLIPLVPLSLSIGVVALWAKKIWLYVPAFLATIALTIATLLTGSRGAYIGIATALFTFLLIAAARCWQLKPKLRPAIVLTLIAIPILAWFALHKIPSFEQRFSSIFAGSEHSSNAFRLQVWHASWKMFLDNWWFGIGPGNKTFILAYGLYMTSGFDALGTYCVPLELAVETGIFGLLSFGAILLAVLSRAHLSFWQSADDFERWLSVGCASALIGLMAHGAVDTVFFRPQVQLIFWLVIALIVSLRIQVKRSP